MEKKDEAEVSEPRPLQVIAWHIKHVTWFLCQNPQIFMLTSTRSCCARSGFLGTQHEGKQTCRGKDLSPETFPHGLPLYHLLFLPSEQSVWILESRQEWRQKVSLTYQKQRKHTVNCENSRVLIVSQFSMKRGWVKLLLTKAKALTTASQNTKNFSPSFHVNWKALPEYWCDVSQLFCSSPFLSPYMNSLSVHLYRRLLCGGGVEDLFVVVLFHFMWRNISQNIWLQLLSISEPRQSSRHLSTESVWLQSSLTTLPTPARHPSPWKC